ncbi:hypothetical protein Plhal703r1_c37g0133851 [Plasmopara halstedii]
MTATSNISHRLCFLLLSCVTLLTYSEISQTKTKMVSYERAKAQRHERALTSTVDQSSMLLEERGASVAVGEEAGLLSRFASHLNLENIWKKIALSRVMKFISPSTYLKNAPDKLAAAYELYQKAGVDKVTKNLFRSSAYRNWSRYLRDAFPNDFKRVAQLRVAVLVEHGQDTLINSILTAQVVRRKLPINGATEAALIEFLANAKGVQNEFAVRLNDALFTYSKNLQKLDGSTKGLFRESFKDIGERLEGELLPTINTKNLVDDGVVRPTLSSKRKGRREHHIYLRDASDIYRAAAILLRKAQVDKAKGDLFTSPEFQTWSKLIEDAFPEKPGLGARIKVIALSKVFGRKRIIDAISTAQVDNGKLAFDEYFIDKMLADGDDFKDSLIRLSKNLQLRGGDSRTIGEQLEGELAVRHIGTRELHDVINLPNVQKWYYSLPKKEGKTPASVLFQQFERQWIKYDTIGDTYLTAKNSAAEKMMKEVVDYVLERRMDKAIVGDSYKFDSWIETAAILKADLTTSVLPTLQKIFSKEKILLLCADVTTSSEEAKALVNKIQNAIKPSKT